MPMVVTRSLPDLCHPYPKVAYRLFYVPPTDQQILAARERVREEEQRFAELEEQVQRNPNDGHARGQLNWLKIRRVVNCGQLVDRGTMLDANYRRA